MYTDLGINRDLATFTKCHANLRINRDLAKLTKSYINS